MQPRFLEKRVEIVENTVSGLEGLPARVEAVELQILQHREETRAAFSANTADHAAFREEMQAFRIHVEKEFVQVRVEIRAGDEDTRRQMRILHEDVIGRFAVFGEGLEETQRQLGELKSAVADLSRRMDTVGDHVLAALKRRKPARKKR